MWIKNYVSATFHRQGIFKYKVLIILFTPYSPFSSRKALALRDFCSPHCSRVFTLCKTALHKLENGVYKISSIMTPLFLHCTSTPSLLNHWTYTGLTLEQHWTHHLPPPTHIPPHISHTLPPISKALQRCNVAALHATFLNHRKHQYIFNYI